RCGWHPRGRSALRGERRNPGRLPAVDGDPRPHFLAAPPPLAPAARGLGAARAAASIVGGPGAGGPQFAPTCTACERRLRALPSGGARRVALGALGARGLRQRSAGV